jgi:hypothetical protein
MLKSSRNFFHAKFTSCFFSDEGRIYFECFEVIQLHA